MLPGWTLRSTARDRNRCLAVTPTSARPMRCANHYDYLIPINNIYDYAYLLAQRVGAPNEQVIVTFFFLELSNSNCFTTTRKFVAPARPSRQGAR